MASGLDKVSKNIAHNLHSLRKSRSLTQAQLAKLAGLTRAAITLLESGSSNPTLEGLLKLSQCLKVSIDEIISAPRVNCVHVQAADIPVDRRSKNGVVLRKLLPEKIPSTEMDELRLSPGAILTGSPHIQGTREYFTCTKGEVTVGVLGQLFKVKEGDVLSFPGDQPHSYKNAGKLVSSGVSVVFFSGTLEIVN